jgi:replicative DNA helicase
MSIILSDVASERAVLAGIIRYGADAYYDVADLISDSTFNNESNKLIYRCIVHLIQSDNNLKKIDLALIFGAAGELGFSSVLSKPIESQHLQAICDFPIALDSTRKFASKIKKLEIAKLLHGKLEQAQQQLLEVTGGESVTQILSMAENAVFDFTSSLNDTSGEEPQLFGDGAKEHLIALGNNPVTNIGIPTCFPIWDKATNALRPGTISVIGARMKVGKSIISSNVGTYVTITHGLPVLYMDTEMLKEDHQYRIISSMSNNVPIDAIETGQYAKYTHMKQNVLDIAEKLKTLPYYHKNISGKPFEEQLAIMRRWLMKNVGINTDGTAKQCLIIYDYLKLMNSSSISNNIAEYQALGFHMSALHDFAIRYQLPILLTIQLNRDGINKESTDVVAGSDRIATLCSNLSICKYKSDEEIAEDGVKNGNRKMVPIISRYGSLLDSKDYINMYFEGQFGRVTEGKTKFQLMKTHQDKNDGFVTSDNVQQDYL